MVPADKTLRFLYSSSQRSHTDHLSIGGSGAILSDEARTERRRNTKIIDLKVEKRCGNFSGY